MYYRYLLLLLFMALGSVARSQQAGDKWNLKQCVEYAMKKNISVRQADVQARIAILVYQQSKLAQLPSANVQNSGGYQFGRSIDPSTNQFTTAEILFANHSLNVNLDLFNWFSKKNTAAANRFHAAAQMAGVEKAKNDIALNVANAYLQILLNGEQIKISQVQVAQSKEQVANVTKQVQAGAVPELNQVNMEAQLATDSSNLITAQANYTLSVLQLKALLNIEADKPFAVEEPSVESIPVELLSDLEPSKVYESAAVNMPQQKINNLNLEAARKNVLVMRGRLYPALSFFGQLDTRYSNAQRLLGKDYVSAPIPIGVVNVNGNNYFVNTIQPQSQPTGFTKNTYFRQISNNFSQAAGLALNIPIFNGGQARTNWKRAKLDVETSELQKEQDGLTLKQDIYQAHTNAVAALQKFSATKKAVDASQKAYDFAKKRFEVGLLNSIDLIISQNNLFSAKINLVSAQYDYVFKMKLLEFYKGQGLKL